MRLGATLQNAVQNLLIYCYANGNGVPSFNIKTINKAIPTNTPSLLKVNHQQQAMCTQYTNNNEVAIELSRKREHEHSTSRTFVRLIA